jgi:DNA-binding NtrC family response regulator
MNDFQVTLSPEQEVHHEKVYFNLEENESNLIRLALKLKNYNQIKTAEILGITRDSLIRRMKKYGISVNKTERTQQAKE